MRWRIRYQLLVPLLLLLLGVVGVSAWTADASAQRAASASNGASARLRRTSNNRTTRSMAKTS